MPRPTRLVPDRPWQPELSNEPRDGWQPSPGLVCLYSSPPPDHNAGSTGPWSDLRLLACCDSFEVGLVDVSGPKPVFTSDLGDLAVVSPARRGCRGGPRRAAVAAVRAAPLRWTDGGHDHAGSRPVRRGMIEPAAEVAPKALQRGRRVVSKAIIRVPGVEGRGATGR